MAKVQPLGHHADPTPLPTIFPNHPRYQSLSPGPNCANCSQYKALLTDSLTEMSKIYDTSQATQVSLKSTLEIDNRRAAGLYTLHEAVIIKEATHPDPADAVVPGLTTTAGPALVSTFRSGSNTDSGSKTGPSAGPGPVSASTPKSIDGIPVHRKSLQMAKSVSEYQHLNNMALTSHKWTWGTDLLKEEILTLSSMNGNKAVNSGYNISLVSGKRYDTESSAPSQQPSISSLFNSILSSHVRLIPPSDPCESLKWTDIGVIAGSSPISYTNPEPGPASVIIAGPGLNIVTHSGPVPHSSTIPGPDGIGR